MWKNLNKLTYLGVHLNIAKPGDHCKVRKGSNGILGSIMGNLQKRFSLFNGVKQGYFVVVATKFVVELGYLNNPEFLKLLKQA